MLVEGVRAVREALEAGADVEFALASERLRGTDGGGELLRRLADAGVDLVEVTDGELEVLAATESPQGVLVVCRQPPDGCPGSLPTGRVLVVDAVQDPGNLGTLVRSAVAFGYEAVVCLDGTADPWSAKAVRGSTAMIFRLPVFRCTVQEVVSVFRDAGVPLFVASGEGSTEMPDLRSFGLVVGNEGAGVREELRSAATGTLAVAMRGPAESLNAGIAGSILMYQLSRGSP